MSVEGTSVTAHQLLGSLTTTRSLVPGLVSLHEPSTRIAPALLSFFGCSERTDRARRGGQPVLPRPASLDDLLIATINGGHANGHPPPMTRSPCTQCSRGYNGTAARLV